LRGRSGVWGGGRDDSPNLGIPHLSWTRKRFSWMWTGLFKKRHVPAFRFLKLFFSLQIQEMFHQKEDGTLTCSFYSCCKFKNVMFAAVQNV
jgi:hypothetical protein